MRADKKLPHKTDKKSSARGHKQGVVGYSKKSALLEEAITHMNSGKYGRSSSALKELLALDPQNTEARRLFATLHLRLGSLVTAREAFESLANEAIGRQDYWLAESLLREYLAAGPRCIPFLELLAHVYQEKGDDMAAVVELGKAIEILLEDPDPDNPKKPAQLYGKIRELAPASPIAFQYASNFDVQTGEIRVPSVHLSGSVLSNQTTDSQPAAERTDHLDEDNTPEVMPWERLDETAPESSTSFAETPKREDPGIDAPPSPMLESEPVAHPTSLELSLPLPSGQGELGMDVEVSGPRDLELPEPTVVHATVETRQDVDASTALIEDSEAPSSSVEIVEAKIEIPERIPSTAERSGESASLPSPMPWEQVADSALEIPRADKSADVQTPAETVAAHQPVSESQPLSTADPTPEPGPFSSIDAELVQAASSTVSTDEKSSTSSTAAPSVSEGFSLPKSFSWNAIFDSAWKIASGTTAPSASAPIEQIDKAEETGESIQLLQPEEFGEATHSSPALTAPPLPESLIDPAAEPLPPVTDESSESLTAAAVAPQDEPSIDEFSLKTESTVGRLAEEPPTPPQAATADDTDVAESQIIQEIEPTLAAARPDSPSASEESPVVAQTAVWAPDVTRDAGVSTQEIESPPAPTSPEGTATSVELQVPEILEPLHASSTGVATEPIHPASEIPSKDSAAGHWNTGEVAVQLHRPSAKKKQWEKESTAGEATVSPTDFRSSVPSAAESPAAWDSPIVEESAPPVEVPAPAPIDERPEWARASDAIVLTQAETAPADAWDATRSGSYPAHEPSPTAAASAVDILFGSTGRHSTGVSYEKESLAVPRRRPRIAARLARMRQNVSSFVGSCFSTTRAFVLLCVTLVILSAVTIALGGGMLALAWVLIEEAPTTRYQSLTNGPQRVITDPAKNGYLLLLGFDAPSGSDANQVGYERRPTDQDQAAAASCMAGGGSGSSNAGATSNVVNGWFKASDPLSQLKGQTETVKSLVGQQATSIARYQQWLSMPFDDWGYGKMLSPNCGALLLAHRLYLLDGFGRDTATGLSRLEKDMDAWRTVLGQSKTLMTKMLAAAAVRDDAAVVSSLLVRPEADPALLARASKIVRPLDQLELSVRWPMQSHFVWATGTVATELKKDRREERPFHVAMAAAMPLPVQRRANAYAEYYDAANRAVAEGRFSSLPKVSSFIRTTPSSLVDYWANPIELIVGIDPLPAWDPYVGRMVETDAQLRLTSLQAWVRRGAQEGDVLARLAKAGQAYYDPFTGLPMLVNQQKRLLYSVGMDGKDQEGDVARDVVVSIPSIPSASDGKSSSGGKS